MEIGSPIPVIDSPTILKNVRSRESQKSRFQPLLYSTLAGPDLSLPLLILQEFVAAADPFCYGSVLSPPAQMLSPVCEQGATCARCDANPIFIQPHDDSFHMTALYQSILHLTPTPPISRIIQRDILHFCHPHHRHRHPTRLRRWWPWPWPSDGRAQIRASSTKSFVVVRDVRRSSSLLQLTFPSQF